MARICRLMEKTWQRNEVSKRVDVLASFLASRPRYRTDAEAREALADTVEIVRESLEDDSFDVARRCLADLESEAAEWADHPHYPRAPRPSDADSQVRDYVKDEVRDQLSVKVRDDDLGLLRMSLGLRATTLTRLPGLAAQEREDLWYVQGRATMALDLGHVEAARRELNRLNEMVERFTAGPPTAGPPTVGR
ncbi:hypothetical protein [Streptomyces sp. NPDC053048]|uniref:hypothetical protein n=1 Tax=Streptomyces sp. NPDC053048 TaxID=3365694 RepID=UPI0037CD866D